MIAKKIEAWIKEVMKGKKEKEMEHNEKVGKGKRKKNLNSSMITNEDLSFSVHEIKCQELDTSCSFSPSEQPPLHLPMSKSCIIKLLKIYKLFIVNEKKFEIDLDPSYLMYLVDLTEKRKGVIEGVRLTLIDVLGKRESLIAENLCSEDEVSEERLVWAAM